MINTLKDNNIDIIIHFAAQSHVQDSFTDSSKYVQDNIVGTHTILEASRDYGKLKKIIHISTDEVYGESLFSDKLQKDEQSVLCPTNPYAATKASAELLASSYYHSFKLPVIITRGNNVYGPNQYPEKLIPRFIKLLRENKKVTIQGDGSNIRSFLHVLDVASAIEHILHKGEIGEIYNIGSDEKEEYTVYEIAKILIKMIHSTKSQTSFNNDEDFINYIEYIQDRPFNDKRYFISNEKLKKLGWNIKIPFLVGIRDLINVS
jgi:UDP-glucose 4,6-dehydratase